MNISVPHTLKWILPFLIITVAVIWAGVIIYKEPSTKNSSEITTIIETQNLSIRIKAYRALMERVGILEAQELLLRSGLPFTGETHLLNHTTGEYAYEKYGIGALQYCRNYFLSSCYHGALIALIAAEGLQVLPEVLEQCRSNPESTVYGQCSHAVGHGLVAWFGYKNLPKALEYCDTLRQEIGPSFPSFNCYDGAFMENVWAIHDGGEPSPDRWVKENDPHFPCSSPIIKESWRGGCWSNQPALLYQRFDGDIEHVAEICNSLTDEKEKNICFNGLARQVHPLTQGDPQRAVTYCTSFPEDRKLECAVAIAYADYSVGGRALPAEICEHVATNTRNSCYGRVVPLFKKDECSLLREESAQESCVRQYLR